MPEWSIPITWKSRLLISLAFALLVGGISLDTVRKSLDRALDSTVVRSLTLRHMKRVEDALDAYHRRTHRWPASLAELKIPAQVGDAYEGPSVTEDFWRRPFVYIVHGDRYTLISYGSDGKPGGTWRASDFYSDRPPPDYEASYADLFARPEIGHILFSTFLTMLICFFITWVGMEKSRAIHLGTIVALVIVGMAAASVAGVITILHVYPEH